MPSLRDVGEAEVLRRLIAARDGRDPRVVVDAGDDAAVLVGLPDHDLAVTTDAFVEDVHYRSEWSSGTALGARLAAANLSDLAAMAATPRWALLSIGARPEDDADRLLEVQRGFAGALDAFGARVVGGNLTSISGPAWWSVTMGGEVAPGRAWTRRGARPDDLVAVTGFPGRAAAGCALAMANAADARTDRWRPLLEAWLSPYPRVGFAAAASNLGGVTAAIDLSDGLAADLGRLCQASRLGVEVDASAMLEDEPLGEAARALDVPRDDLRLGPSDDYELLLAIAPQRRHALEALAAESQVPFAVIGRLTDRADLRVMRDSDGASHPLPHLGFDHFRRL